MENNIKEKPEGHKKPHLFSIRQQTTLWSSTSFYASKHVNKYFN
jgi:hypothetical protein